MKAFAGAVPKHCHNAPKKGALCRRWYFAGVAAIVVILFANTVVTEREGAWEDEIFAVSTAWSIVHSKPPHLSVLAQYPGTGSPLRFYGPVSFEAEALLIRMFGLSATVWRLVCLAGVILSIWAALRLVHLAGGDKWAATHHCTGHRVVRIGRSVSWPMGRNHSRTFSDRPAAFPARR